MPARLLILLPGCLALTVAASACNLDFAERDLPLDVSGDDAADLAPADTAADTNTTDIATDLPADTATDAPLDAPDTDCGCGELACCEVGGELACIDLDSDPMHCGACGTVCALDQRCLAGDCCERATCTDENLLCGSHADFCGGVRTCGVCPESAPICGVGRDGQCGTLGVFRVPDTATVYCIGADERVCPRPGEPLFGQDGHHRRYLPRHTIDAATTTLHDHVTGLDWAIGSIDPIDAASASSACAAIGANGEWRVPSLFELLTLADYGQLESIFAATASIGNLDLRLLSNIATPQGQLVLATRTGDTLRDTQGSLICVRGTTPPRVFVAMDLGYVLDDSLGLMWTNLLRGPSPWHEALDQCDDLTTGGYEDWRLPTLQELAALLVVDTEGGRIDPALGVSASQLWSGTPDAPSSTGALASSSVRTLDFAGLDAARLDPTTRSAAYLCVRHAGTP